VPRHRARGEDIVSYSTVTLTLPGDRLPTQAAIQSLIEQTDLRYVAIEGVIGAGKTTLSSMLGETLGARVVLEQFEENPFLKDFYRDPERFAFQTQIFFLLTRYKQQRNLSQADLFHRFLVTDYIFEKDKIFAFQTLSDDELVVYEKIYGVLAERVPKPDLVIYLQIGLPTLMKRISKDGSPLERNISEKYLQDLIEAFDYFFFNYQASPLLVIKSDDLDLASEADLDDVLDQLRHMKKTSLFYVPPSFAGREGRRK